MVDAQTQKRVRETEKYTKLADRQASREADTNWKTGMQAEKQRQEHIRNYLYMHMFTDTYIVTLNTPERVRNAEKKERPCRSVRERNGVTVCDTDR